MVGRNYFCEIKKLYSEKKLFPEINYSNVQGKIFFLGTTSLLWITVLLWVFSYYFTKVFVLLLVIAAVCYFSVYKLIGWDSKSTAELKK